MLIMQIRICMHNPPDSDEPCKEEHPLIELDECWANVVGSIGDNSKNE